MQAFRAALRRLTRSGVAGAGGAGGAARFGAARLLASKADKRHLLRQDDLVQLVILIKIFHTIGFAKNDI